jgi:hypothetical protein
MRQLFFFLGLKYFSEVYQWCYITLFLSWQASLIGLIVESKPALRRSESGEEEDDDEDMSILTSVQFYLPAGVGVLCLIMVMASMFGNCWRTVEYDGLKALELLDTSSRVQSIAVNDADGFISMNLTGSNESYIKVCFPMMNYGGLWGSCDTIPGNMFTLYCIH